MNNEHTSVKYLDTKVWFRALKVIYIFCYFTAFSLILLLGYSMKPYKSIDTDKSVIRCTNGKIFRAGKNGVLIIDGNPPYLYSADDEKARKSCASNTSFLPDEKNYSLDVKYETINSWSSVFSFILIAIPIVIVIFEIIKRVFLYVTIGKFW